MKAMDESKVYLAKITVCCPECDKLFAVERYIEQFKPINRDSLFVKCFECSVSNGNQ